MIRTARKETGRSREEVAKAAGVSPRALANLELGAGSLQVFEAVAREIDFRLAKVARGANLADKLKTARARRGLSMEALADRAGVSVSTIRNLEQGVGHITSLEAVLAVLAPTVRVRKPETTNWEAGGRDDRLSPMWLLDVVITSFGPISLDPCASERALIPADRHYYKKDDGLAKPWDADIVYMNPPFSEGTRWIERARAAWSNGEAKTVIGLLPARTNAKVFHTNVVGHADLIFLHGKPPFRVEDKGERGIAIPLMLAVWGGHSRQARDMASRLSCSYFPRAGHEVFVTNPLVSY